MLLSEVLKSSTRLKPPKYHEKDTTKETLVHFAELIKQNCQEICSIYAKVPGKYLWRGESHDIAAEDTVAFENEINKARKPTALSVKKQTEFDNGLKKLGATAVRGNSLFTMTTTEEVKSWGGNDHVYAIFPVDGFKYTWFEGIDYMSYYDITWSLNLYGNLKPRFDQLEAAYKTTGKHQDGERGIKGQHEVLITGTKYYAVLDDYVRQLKKLVGF